LAIFSAILKDIFQQGVIAQILKVIGKRKILSAMLSLPTGYII